MRGAVTGFAGEVRHTLETRAILFAVAAARSVVLARGLGPEGRGIFALATTTATIVTAVASVQIGKALVYYAAQQGATRDLGRTASTLTLLTASVAAATALGAGQLVERATQVAIPAELLLAIAALSFVNVGVANMEGLLRGLRLLATVNRAQVLGAIIFFALVGLGFAARRLTPTTAVVALAATGGILFALYCAQAMGSEVDLRPGIDRAISRSLAAYGGLYVGQSLVTLLHQRADLYLIGVLLEPHKVGLYAQAVGVTEVLNQLPVAIVFVLVPWVAKGRREGDDGASRTPAAARLTAAGLAVAGLVIAISAAFLVRHLYGVAFLPSVLPLRMLLPGAVMNGVFLVTAAELVGTNRLRSLLLVNVLAVSVNVTLNLALLPRFGIVGAGAASSITYSLVALAVIRLVKARPEFDGLGYRDFLVPSRKDLRYALEALKGRRVATGDEIGS